MFHKPIATIAINLRPRRGSWGGANQWTSQVTRYLRYCGYNVRHDLSGDVDLILMTHTGLAEGTAFLDAEVRDYKKRHPHVRCIQRINDNDIRKGTDSMDALLQRCGEIADHTVFVSGWLRDYHAAKWFDSTRPHTIIEPGADPGVFHPLGNQPPKQGEPYRVATHHWSDNMAKGFDIYSELDQAIASGQLKNFELVVIGRWPKEIQWKSARTFGPASGRQLAELLRSCHLYISASRYEPGAMHPVEGLQCGLPLIYHQDSGGTVNLGLRYGVLWEGPSSLLAIPEKYLSLRNTLLQNPPSGDRMSATYRELIQRELCQ